MKLLKYLMVAVSLTALLCAGPFTVASSADPDDPSARPDISDELRSAE
ncbi:hypothetical protein ACFL2Q_20350 [Thermodesulfobacteriota bacterium]